MKKTLVFVGLLLMIAAPTAFAAPPPMAFSVNPALLLPSGCSNGQYPTYTAATNRWSCATASGTGDLLANGTVPLTAHWNVGAYNITASSFIGALTGNASTATALAADPANCSAGQLSLGVNASGVAECTATPSLQALTLTGANTLGLGTAGSAVGSVNFKNATSGYITVQPITGALGTPTLVLGTTYTDGKWCKYTTAAGFTCNEDAPAGTGDFKADGSVAMTGALNAAVGLKVGNGATGAGYIQIMEDSDNGTDYSSITGTADAGSYPGFTFSGSGGLSPTLIFQASSGLWTINTGASGDTFAVTQHIAANGSLAVKNGSTSAGYIDFYEDSDDGSNYHRIIAAAMAGNVTTYLPNAAGATGGLWYFSAANQLANLGIGTANQVLQTNSAATAPEWTSSLSVSSIAMGSGYISFGSDPADAGALRFSNADKLMWEASAAGTDVEALSVDSSEVVQIGAAGASGVTITPNLTVAGTTTHSDNVTMADSKKIIFDESAADPNDADIELSATDGVFKIAAANGANNEDLTIDLDQTANTAILSSGTGLTMITTGSIALTGAVRVSAKDADYTIGTDNANEAYGGFFFNTAASTRTFTLPSAVAGMSVCIKNAQGVAQVLRLDANTGDYIVKSDGTRTSAAAEYYGCASSASCMVCVVAYDATDWHVTAERGTWTEE